MQWVQYATYNSLGQCSKARSALTTASSWLLPLCALIFKVRKVVFLVSEKSQLLCFWQLQLDCQRRLIVESGFAWI